MNKDVYKKGKMPPAYTHDNKRRSPDFPILGRTKIPLPPLKIVGPISTLVTSVRVQGQSQGAEVLVISLADHQIKARGIATHGDQRFALLPNVALNHDDRLVATQTLGIDVSEMPGEYQSVSVQQAPLALADIGEIKIESCYLYAGEYHLWVTGCIPGAMVEAFFNGTVQGRTISQEGVARLSLAAKLKTDTPVSIRQMVEGIGTGFNPSITPERRPEQFFEERGLCQHGLLAS